MRPYLVLVAVVLVAVAAFGQQPYPRPTDGACFYGCGPYVPLITTPEISLQSVSPNSVGASNATTGLIAGATNATVSQIQGPTSSEYTVPVWYQGGAPLTTPAVHLWSEPIGRQGRPMHDAMHEVFRGAVPEEGPREGRPGEELGPRREHVDWTYLTGEYAPEAEQPGIGVKGARKATRTYTNEDIQRENEKNGTVKYDDKTEKI